MTLHKVLHGVDASENKTSFSELIARVFMPFRQFDWFYRAFLLVLSIFSFYLIERCDFFALFLRQLIEVFSSNPKKYLKNLCILHVFKQKRFFKENETLTSSVSVVFWMIWIILLICMLM